jgi:hypothetical protein
MYVYVNLNTVYYICICMYVCLCMRARISTWDVKVEGILEKDDLRAYNP